MPLSLCKLACCSWETRPEAAQQTQKSFGIGRLGEMSVTEPDFALLHGNTTKWTLEDDSNLVKILTQISDNVVLQTKKLQDDVEKLSYDTNAAGVNLGNVFSEFLQIANTQFVENRVYEIDANPDEESGAGNNVEGGNKQGSADASNTVDPGERAEQGPGKIQVRAVPWD